MNRMGWFALISVILLALVEYVAPQELPVALWKLSLITVSAYVGYWVDRHLFPYGRPDKIAKPHFTLAMIRRAIIVSATMIAFSLAL